MELQKKQNNIILDEPRKVMDYINNLWNEFPEYDKGRENMFILYLNVKNVLLSVELHAQGTIDDGTAMEARGIKKALFCNSGSIILIHNHISNDCTPSIEDKHLTSHLKKVCKFMDIVLLDHIIICDNGHYSFQEENIL
mgnify:CR=1 FL=1